MDDNAQKPAVSDSTAPVAQAPQQTTPPSVQLAGDAKRPMEAPSAPRHPEQGPVQRVREVQTTPEEAEAASSVQASSDDSPDTPETPAGEQDAEVKESHPDVEIAPELKDVGVSASDTQRDQLLEEKKQMVIDAPEDPVQAAVTTDEPTLEKLSQMDLVQAEEAAKVEKKPRNALSWIIREVLRFRKQEQPPVVPPTDPAAVTPAEPVAQSTPPPQPTPAPAEPKEGVAKT